MILAGDIGGTKTVLSIFTNDENTLKPLAERTCASSEFAGLEQVIQAFLDDHDHPIESAAFGVAGPVMEGRAKITNLP